MPVSVQEAGFVASSVQELRRMLSSSQQAVMAANFPQRSRTMLGCSQQAEMVANFPQRSRKMLDCSQQAEMVANFPRRSRKMLGSSQHVGVLENFLQKWGLSSLPLAMMAENFLQESRKGLISSLRAVMVASTGEADVDRLGRPNRGVRPGRPERPAGVGGALLPCGRVW